MEELDYTALMERYQSLPVEELLRLNDRKEDLTPLAQQALAHAVSRRRGEFAVAVKTRAADEAADLAALERNAEIQWERQVREDKRFKWYLIIVSALLALWFIIDLSREPGQRAGLPLNLLVTVVAVIWAAKLAQRFWKPRPVRPGGVDQGMKPESYKPSSNGLTRKRKLLLLISLALLILAAVNDFGEFGWFGQYGKGVFGLAMFLMTLALPRETWERKT